MDCHLLRQKVHQWISIIPENWHFNSCFFSKTAITAVFVFVTEILWRTFWLDKWRSVFDVVKRLRLSKSRKEPLTLCQAAAESVALNPDRLLTLACLDKLPSGFNYDMNSIIFKFQSCVIFSDECLVTTCYLGLKDGSNFDCTTLKYELL